MLERNKQWTWFCYARTEGCFRSAKQIAIPSAGSGASSGSETFSIGLHSIAPFAAVDRQIAGFKVRSLSRISNQVFPVFHSFRNTRGSEQKISVQGYRVEE
jgi:hypothetical protein